MDNTNAILPDVQRRLAETENRLAALHREQVALEGKRDSLLRQLTDLEGAHDRRPVAVR